MTVSVRLAVQIIFSIAGVVQTTVLYLPFVRCWNPCQGSNSFFTQGKKRSPLLAPNLRRTKRQIKWLVTHSHRLMVWWMDEWICALLLLIVNVVWVDILAAEEACLVIICFCFLCLFSGRLGNCKVNTEDLYFLGLSSNLFVLESWSKDGAVYHSQCSFQKNSIDEWYSDVTCSSLRLKVAIVNVVCHSFDWNLAWNNVGTPIQLTSVFPYPSFNRFFDDSYSLFLF